MENPIKGLKDRFVEIKIGEDTIKAKPCVGDAEAFITMKKDMDEKDAKTISRILIDMIARANPDLDKEDIGTFVAMHYGELILQIAVVFGFRSQKEVDEAKKKLILQEQVLQNNEK